MQKILAAMVVAAVAVMSTACGDGDSVAKLRRDVGGLQRDMYSKGGRVPNVEERATRVERNLAAVQNDLNGIERRLSGHAREATSRMGALEDTQGVDHNRRLLILSGFATGKYELSSAMEKKLDEAVVGLVGEGWTIRIVVGFADNQPFLVNGEDKNPELSLMRARTTASYLAGKLGVTVPSDGRGATTKFGGLDVNRSVLIYLERGK